MKILWGFEPFQRKTSLAKKMYNFLQPLAGTERNIEIGYITTGTEAYLNTAYNIPRDERYTIYPHKLIANEMKRSKVPIDEKQIHVIHYNTLSTTAAADRFLSLGKNRKADTIALFSNNRKGIERFFVGSFAETIVHRSQQNVIVVSPQSQLSGGIKNILFSSDFSSGSKNDIMKVVALCKRMGAKLTVLHAAQIIYKWAENDQDKYVLQYRNSVDRAADAIRSICKRAGVSCDIIITAEFKAISESIVAKAKKVKADLIVVAAKTGPMKALIGGSITRQVLRLANRPVLVMKGRS